MYGIIRKLISWGIQENYYITINFWHSRDISREKNKWPNLATFLAINFFPHEFCAETLRYVVATVKTRRMSYRTPNLFNFEESYGKIVSTANTGAFRHAARNADGKQSGANVFLDVENSGKYYKKKDLAERSKRSKVMPV